MATPLLLLENISKTYSTPDGTLANPVFQEINLGLAPGESLAVVGPSGSGKSTLLNIIGTLDRPTSGTVKIDGQEVSVLSEPELALIRNRQIGFIFQLHHLLPQLTVLENVLLPTLPFSKIPLAVKDSVEWARHLLERVELTPRTNYFPGQLSGGERQRAAVVRALINRPALLLADEPTGSLDYDSAVNLVELLLELNREENIALVMVTHSLELAGGMGKTLRLAGGKLS
ncbi:MAG TPA: ABC transporter ATP-binding protein [Bacillota bacterium]|nr:ABC transporter ATP-binding protein [Bacillota bacterium]